MDYADALDKVKDFAGKVYSGDWEGAAKWVKGVAADGGCDTLFEDFSKANGPSYNTIRKQAGYKGIQDVLKAGAGQDCMCKPRWKPIYERESIGSAWVACTDKTTGASGCSGCRPDQTQYEKNNPSKGGSLWYGRILWPGLLAKNTGGDQGGNLFRPVMVGDVWTPQVAFEAAEAPGAALPDPTSDQLAPGWTRDTFKKAAAGVRPSILAAESQAEQPAANLDYFWKAVAKYAPESAAYYINAGVPVPPEVAGTVHTIAAQHAGLSPAALLLLAVGAWYLIKK